MELNNNNGIPYRSHPKTKVYPKMEPLNEEYDRINRHHSLMSHRFGNFCTQCIASHAVLWRLSYLG